MTPSEWVWLRRRHAERPYCAGYCDAGYRSEPCDWSIAVGDCPMYPTEKHVLDAAEFESKVAARLVDAYWPPLVYTPVAPFEQRFMLPADRLKWARLKVEEEMDADGK